MKDNERYISCSKHVLDEYSNKMDSEKIALFIPFLIGMPVAAAVDLLKAPAVLTSQLVKRSKETEWDKQLRVFKKICRTMDRNGESYAEQKLVTADGVEIGVLKITKTDRGFHLGFVECANVPQRDENEVGRFYTFRDKVDTDGIVSGMWYEVREEKLVKESDGREVYKGHYVCDYHEDDKMTGSYYDVITEMRGNYIIDAVSKAAEQNQEKQGMGFNS